MANNSRMVRVHSSFDEFLENYSLQLSQQLGRRVTKTEASLIMVKQQPNIVIFKKKGRRSEQIGFGSVFQL